jgi:hypothetical protein
MNAVLMVLECPETHEDTDHELNTVTAVATCETCGAETQLTPVELADILA